MTMGSLSLIAMVIDSLSLLAMASDSLSLLAMTVDSLLVVGICSLSLGPWTDLLLLFLSLVWVRATCPCPSLGHGHLFSPLVFLWEICSFSFSHSLWVRATCPCPSLGHGHLFSPLVFLWEIHTFFSLFSSVGHKHLLLSFSGHCHLFSIFFSPLTTAGCSLLFPQKKHLLSLPYLPSFSFLCYLNLSTSVSVSSAKVES